MLQNKGKEGIALLVETEGCLIKGRCDLLHVREGNSMLCIDWRPHDHVFLHVLYNKNTNKTKSSPHKTINGYQIEHIITLYSFRVPKLHFHRV